MTRAVAFWLKLNVDRETKATLCIRSFDQLIFKYICSVHLCRLASILQKLALNARFHSIFKFVFDFVAIQLV